MNYSDFDIELLTPIAVPARSRSLDDAGSRRFIPGAALLGCAARVLYPELDDDDAFRIFQTAAVRFLDGRPVAGDHRTWPLPRSLHRLKHGAAGEPYNLVDKKTRGELLAKAQQVEPIKGNLAVAPDLSSCLRLDGVSELTLRTSVTDEGRAASGLLYSLDVLPAGLRFRARVGARRTDDLERIAKALTRHDHRVGRAKSAELGRVRVTRAEGTEAGSSPPPDRHRCAFLCVSSVALRDPRTGMPTFTVRPEDVGLPASWRFEAASSFVRTERYSPFHGTRRLPDLERQLIARGSVLTFAGEAPADLDTVIARLAGGVGEFRHTGLGELTVMAGPLLAARPALPAATPWEPPRPTEAAAPADALFTWASEQAGTSRSARELFKLALDEARVAARSRVPPAQWGQLRALARTHRAGRSSGEVFLGAVKKHLTTGVAKLDRLWGRPFKGGTVSQWLLARLEARGDRERAAFLEQMAELVVREMRTYKEDGR